MKKIIDGHRYDTDAAKLIGEQEYSHSSDFNWWHEELYRTKSGRFFIFGEGGPASRYAVTIASNEWSGGERIIPITEEDARKFAEEALDADDYEAVFGAVDEDTVKISADLTAADKIKLDEIKAATGKTTGELITGWIRTEKK